MKKEIKVEWCENFIKARFTKHHAFPGPNAGIEVNCFWKMAEASGLWERGTYRALGYHDGKQFDPTSRLAGTPERTAIGG